MVKVNGTVERGGPEAWRPRRAGGQVGKRGSVVQLRFRRLRHALQLADPPSVARRIRIMTGYGTLGAPRTHLRPLQPRAQPLFRWWMGKKTISVHPYWQRIKRRHQVAPGVGAF